MASQFYSDRSLDRASLLRESAGDTEGNTNRKQRLIPIRQGQFFFEYINGSLHLLTTIPEVLMPAASDFIFLGIHTEEEIYCVEVSPADQNDLGSVTLLDIRKAFPLLEPREAALLAYAQGITAWNQAHLYCGKCGSTTLSQQKGHSRICSNAACKNRCYPRIDPAVIVLIEYRPENGPALCLLNKRETPTGIRCSAFAGFVEIGESLEDAIHRELQEEVGLEVDHIRYMSSQPWPFPSALMLGFTAEATHDGFHPGRKGSKRCPVVLRPGN